MDLCKVDTPSKYDSIELLDSFKRGLKSLFGRGGKLNLGWKGGDVHADFNNNAGTNVKNIANEAGRSLHLGNAMVLMNNLSDMNNHSLHKLFFNTATHRLIPRVDINIATGDISKELVRGEKMLKMADYNLANKNIDATKQAYRELEYILYKLGAEIMAQEVMFKNEVS